MAYDPRFRRTKIVATIGPATARPEVLGALLEAGVDVVRVNSSHGSAEERIRLMRLVRETAGAKGRHVAILVDLQGPRIRVGVLPEPRQLDVDQVVVFAPEERASGDEIPTTYAALAQDVAPGSRILLDDGLLAVEVQRIEADRVRCVVTVGGELRGQKGINLPDVQVSAPAVTEKDCEDVALAVEHGADYVGVSFVSRPEDLAAVRALVPPGVQLVAKIERAAALERLDDIVEAADAVMVARGDLGVELPFEEVPLVQKHLIRLATSRGRAVITATQMLESMIDSPRPTRAEASDVANAILDGTDAVMLSAETAVGSYPVEAVQAMARIISEIERATIDTPRVPTRRRRSDTIDVGERRVEDAIAVATTAAAEMLDARAIVCFTKSGFTARTVSVHRPRVPIVSFSTEAATCCQLQLVWGVVPELVSSEPNYDARLETARAVLLEKSYLERGDLVVVTAGVPFEVPGTTNLLKVEVI